MHVRPVQPEELARFRELRLNALAESPGAFGARYDDEVRRPLSDWNRWVSTGRAFVADDGSDWYGVVAVVPDSEDTSTRHVVSMWVAPTRRGEGIGRLLIDAAVDFAKNDGVAVLKLGVVDGNDLASRLYQRRGFVPTDEHEPLRSNSSRTIRFLRLDLAE